MTQLQHQEPLANKLHILQKDNDTLRHEKEDFQLNLRKYVKSISQMEDELHLVKKQNEQFSLQNQQLRLKNRQQELAIQRINEQYKILHEHQHLDTRKSTRGIILKEIELNNQLNRIHEENYQTVIITLKESIQKKDQQLIQFNQETAKLKMDLLNCTHQYHQIINKLKVQVSQLKANSSTQVKKPSSPQQTTISRLAEEQLAQTKNQLDLMERENQKLLQELLKCKKELVHFKSQAEGLRVAKQESRFENSSMDFNQIRKIVEQNMTLKKQLDYQLEKFSTLVRNNPMLMSQLDEIDLISPMQELQQRYDSLTTISGEQINQIKLLSDSNNKIEQEKSRIQDQYSSYRAQVVKVFSKLKGYIKNYIPCFEYYGFEQFLNEEESKFVQETGTDIYKQYDKMSSDLVQKNSLIKKLQSKLRQLENKQKVRDKSFTEQSNTIQNLRKQNKSLISVLDSLQSQFLQLNTKIHNRTQKSYSLKSDMIAEEHVSEYQQAIENQEPSQAKEQNEQEAHQEPVNESEVNFFQGQSEQQQEQAVDVGVRRNVLQQLVIQLQKQYQQSLNLIREKDQEIVELHGELKVIKNESSAKHYTFQTVNSKVNSNLITGNTNQKNVEELLVHSKEEYLSIKKNITSMSQQYQTELHLLQEQHQKKFTSLNLKYVNLLTSYKELQHKFTLLQNLYQQALESKKEQKGDKPQEVQQENIPEIQDLKIDIKDDKNVVSQATIQSITDLLKKYEKQFGRFAQLYQQVMTKTKNFKCTKEPSSGSSSVQQELEQKIQRIVGILNQNQQTIDVLQKELENNHSALESTKQDYLKQEEKYKSKISQMEERVAELLGQLQNIRGKNIQQSSEGGENRPQVLNSFMVMLSHKNQEINSLQKLTKERQEQINKMKQEVQELHQKLQVHYSELEHEEYRRLRQFVIESGLGDVLEQVNQILIERREQSNAEKQMIEQ